MLSDFGLAKIVEDNSQSISMSGSFAGTYNYMAPEVFNNVDITPASDVYALGCVIYEMLMGHMLFDSKTPGEIVSAHIKGITIDEQLPDDSPDGTRRVLQTALAKEPEKRYQSAGELAQELLQLSTDRLAEPYVTLKQAIAKHRWQEAVTIASEIRSQDPNYRDVESLEETALSEYRVGQRRYWSAQWQTSAEQALATENFDEARISITRWRHVAPDDPKLPLVERDLLLAERYVALQYLMAEEDWQAAQDKAAVIANQNPAYRNVLGLQARISANLEEPTPELGTKSTTEENATPPLSYTPTASQKSGSGVPAWIWWVVAIIVILIVIFVLYSLI